MTKGFVIVNENLRHSTGVLESLPTMRFQWAIVLIASSLSLAGVQSTAARKTVWTGVFSSAQAGRGQKTYEANCSRCHGPDLTSNPQAALTGSDFMQKWREDNVDSLFTFIRTSMPPMRRGGPPRVPLPDNDYLDIVAYILQSNRFPAGDRELVVGELPDIHIEEKDGPKPVPNSALVIVVGCMQKLSSDVWTLVNTTEPVRTRVADVATSDELKNDQAKAPGDLTFRLQNLAYLGPNFGPEKFEGHRMQAKGILIRQPNAERIDVRSLAEVSESCPK